MFVQLKKITVCVPDFQPSCFKTQAWPPQSPIKKTVKPSLMPCPWYCLPLTLVQNQYHHHQPSDFYVFQHLVEHPSMLTFLQSPYHSLLHSIINTELNLSLLLRISSLTILIVHPLSIQLLNVAEDNYLYHKQVILTYKIYSILLSKINLGRLIHKLQLSGLHP